MNSARSQLVGVCLAWSVATCAIADLIEGQVVGITDGDSLTLLVKDVQFRIRLENIDAPERGQPFGDRAKQALSDLTYAKHVACERSGLDRYGRSLATCTESGKDINAEMLRLGMVWVFTRYAPRSRVPEYYRFEEEAKRSKHGLWDDDIPVPPWEWRSKRRAP